jgi:hypothetical protein
MKRALPRPPLQPDFDRVLPHCERYWALAPRTYPRGVFKFRTLAEAQRARPGCRQTPP